MSIHDLVSKDLDTIRQEMFDRLAEKQEEYYAKGWLPVRLNLNKGIVRGMIELWCWGLWQLYQFLALVLLQAFPDTATGLWLDLHCKQVGVARKAATKASGTAYFCREVDGGNVPIPAGRIIRTKPDATGAVYRYVTTAPVVLLAGSLEVAVPIEAEEYGSAANASAGQISEIVTVIPGVDTVENRAGWLTSEGVDAETDEPLRLRYQLAWKVLNGCTKYAYEAWAREVTGVAGVRILDQHPRGQGTVDVIVVGTTGIPTQNLIDLVTANILGTGNNDEKQPINDDVQIYGPAAVPVTISAQLLLTAGDPVETIAAVDARLRALFNVLPNIAGIDPLGVGADMTRDRLTWAMLLPNIKSVIWTAPVTDVAVANNALATIESINLTWAWAGEA